MRTCVCALSPPGSHPLVQPRAMVFAAVRACASDLLLIFRFSPITPCPHVQQAGRCGALAPFAC
eukprot:6004133-Pleurochrysis_carterae.AAC.1